MKFEVGKKYQTREGRAVTLVADLSPYNTHRYNCLVFLGPSGDLFSTNSSGTEFHPAQSSNDVTQEWKEPLKKTVCGTVRKKGTIYHATGNEYLYSIDWEDSVNEWHGRIVRVTIEEVEE